MGWRAVAYTALGLTSVVLLGATAYAWTQLSRLTEDLAVADVIDPAAQLPRTTPDVPVHEQNILLVGIDARTDAQGNPLPRNVLDELHAGDSGDGGDTTDTMMVVHVAEGGEKATGISIPRDSYVDIAGGHGRHKINSAYSYGKQAALDQLSQHGFVGADLERRADQAGARTAIQTVEQFTGLTINHYAAVNLVGFYTLSLAVGGVPVCLAAPAHDSYSGADFPAGPQVLSGANALAFVRQRHGLSNDLDRIARQQAFLSSAAKVVLAADTLVNPVKLSRLIGAVRQSVVIDSGWDILTFAQQMRALGAGGLEFETIPVQSVDLQTPYDGEAVKVDPGEVRTFIEVRLGKSTRGTATRTPASTTTAPSSYRPSPTTSAPPVRQTAVRPYAYSTPTCVN